MKASEARILSDKNNSQKFTSLLNSIRNQIENSTNNGLYTVQYNLDFEDVTQSLIRSVISVLEQDGYEVEHNRGNDQRNGDSWNYLNISW